MSTDADSSRKHSVNIKLRLQPSTSDLIDRAATAAGKCRTKFIVEAARREAEIVLVNRCFFALNANAYAAFTAALDQPPADNPCLQVLLRNAAPWD
jgi:uncharacterized protein (DUF1778 family)